MSKLADWLLPENDDGSGWRITPDVLATGGGGAGAGGLGTLLLLNLFREQVKGNGSGNNGVK